MFCSYNGEVYLFTKEFNNILILQVILDGEEHSLEVPAAANPLEDSNERMNRLTVMEKRLLEAKKRKRLISSVHRSNSVHVSFCVNLNLQ